MKLVPAAIVAASVIMTSGCFSVSTNLPQHPEWNPDKQEHPSRNLAQKPSLSILVKREKGTDAVDDNRLKTIQNNLKELFRRSNSFGRISTGTNPEPADYSVELVFSEFYLKNNGVLCAGKEEEQYSFLITLGILPARIARYDSTYLLIYNDNQRKLFSRGLLHRDTWYGWPTIVFAPLVNPFCANPTDKSILISLIRDIQFQGGFDDLNMNIK